MTLDFLLKAFRQALQKSSPQNQVARPDERPEDQLSAAANNSSDHSKETLHDEAIDPFNPFPDPVVIEFRDVLDLHSIPPKYLRAVVEDYLEEAHTRGFRYLRIIHGKGIGVQREMVRSILSRTPFAMHYQDAPMEAGGWGATIVTLDVKDRETEMD
jgi:DNA-nicking Smr family endonuclease